VLTEATGDAELVLQDQLVLGYGSAASVGLRYALGLETYWSKLQADDRFAFTEVINTAIYLSKSHIH